MENQSTIGILDEFQTELINGWRQLPNKRFFFGLLAVWLALFQFFGNSTFGFLKTPSLLKWLYIMGMANSPEGEMDDHQMILAPFLVLGLFWWKRKELLALPKQVWMPALGFVILGLFFHIVGFRLQQPRISIVGLFTGIYGLMGLAWGARFLRASIFPFFLFIFCVPFGTMGQFITVPLRLMAMRIVEVIAHLLHLGVVRQGTELMDPVHHYKYEVAAACGGLRSLVMTVMLAVVFGFVVFKSAWKRLLLLALAVPLAVAGNVLRLLMIILAARFFGGQEAGASVHDNAVLMLVPYVPAIFVLLWLGDRLEPKTIPAGGVPA